MLSQFVLPPTAHQRAAFALGLHPYRHARGSKADLWRFFLYQPSPALHPSPPPFLGCLDSGNGVDVSDPCPLITRRCGVLAGQSSCSGSTPRRAGCCHCEGPASKACAKALALALSRGGSTRRPTPSPNPGRPDGGRVPIFLFVWADTH